MRTSIVLFILVLIIAGCKTTKELNSNVVTTGIENFWEAYDKITTTQDTSLQYALLDSLYLRKGTVGLNAIREVRNYTPQDYINSINSYPLFWSSIRPNTDKVDQYAAVISQGIDKLRAVYPNMRPAKMYFTIGSFRTGGTTLDSLVLIGSEIALADSTTVTKEFPENLSHLVTYYKTNPKDDLVFLNVHEYIHTQQKEMVFNLLSLVIYEGVAEFISTKALNVPSPNPQISFGKENAASIRETFEQEMFYIVNRGKWLNGDVPNRFGMRDLGYAVGYQMCENYYDQAKDKDQAIQHMIDLDYNDEDEIEDFVAKSNYFSAPLDSLYQRFEESRPTIVSVEQFDNKSTGVSSELNEITLVFSEPLNGISSGLSLGPLDRVAFPKITSRGWSDDAISFTIKIELEPHHSYQILVDNNFRTASGIPLKPLLIEFETGD